MVPEQLGSARHGEREGLGMGHSPTRSSPSWVMVVSPSGRLNVTAARGLREQLQALMETGNTRLVVDLSAVDNIDSSGLGALIFGLKAARQRGGDLRVAAANGQVQSVLDLAQLGEFLKSCPTADEAFDSAPQTIVFETQTGPATLDEIQDILDEALSGDAAIPEDVRMNVSTAVGEVAANIVEHAAQGRPVALRMELHLLRDEVRVEFTDTGSAADIDLGAVAMPDPMAERGRGLAMTLAVLRELSYRRDESGNHWTLISQPCSPAGGRKPAH